MKLRIALEEKLFDKRVRDRLVAEGKITKEEVKKYLDSLSDDASNAEVAEESEKHLVQ